VPLTEVFNVEVAVIVAVPAETAVITPEASTVATELLFEDQVTEFEAPVFAVAVA